MPNKKKECDSDKILNPITNRCVNRNGKIGKTLLSKKPPKKTKKECDPDKIINPITNRCVKKDGKIGKAILAKKMKEQAKNIKAPKKEVDEKKTKKIDKPPKTPKQPKIDKPRFKLDINIPIDHSLNREQVKKYINACDLEVRPIIKKIFNNTVHISFEEFIKNLNKNIKDLLNLTNKSKKIFFYINEFFKEKSNYWVYKYVKNYIKYNNPDYNIFVIDNLNKNKNGDYIVFVDDCIYSGNQLASELSEIKNKHLLQLNYYILAPYISENGRSNIEERMDRNKDFNKSNSELIFSAYSNDIPLIDDYLTDSDFTILYKYLEYFMMEESIEGKYLIYFDHKLADNISTITPIYSGYVMNKHNLVELVEDDYYSTEFYDLSDDEKLEQFEIIPVINNCNNKINFDFLHPVCPYTPYKKKFNKYIAKTKDEIVKYRSEEEKPKQKAVKLSL